MAYNPNTQPSTWHHTLFEHMMRCPTLTLQHATLQHALQVLLRSNLYGPISLVVLARTRGDGEANGVFVREKRVRPGPVSSQQGSPAEGRSGALHVTGVAALSRARGQRLGAATTCTSTAQIA